MKIPPRRFGGRLACLTRPGAFGLLLLLLIIPTVGASAQEPVVVASFEGVINPVAAEYLDEAVSFAEEKKAQLLVFELDTPGGLDTSMRLMIKDMTAAQMPVAVFVYPPGGRAASAGVFITMAAHLAAMAPGTNIGAAHPVAMGGGEMDEVMKEKVENDAVAYIKSIAERRGRNAEWAQDAVKKSVSATAEEALELNIIDVVAEDLEDLLARLDGREIALGERPVVLDTKETEVVRFPMSWRLDVLQTISNPNIAYVLMTIGMIGLLAELYNPGAILPGVVGAISLIMAFYSLQSLPVNYAGVLLLVLGVVLFILEAMVASFGILALGGIVSMVLGSLLLIKSDAQFLQISWAVIIPVVAGTAAISLFVVGMGVKALRRRAVTGSEGMIGLIGMAKTDLTPHGMVHVHGENWDAIGEQPIQEGESVEVTRVEGLKLYVRPVRQKEES